MVRDGMDLTNTGIAFLQLLDAHKIRSERTSHWPGTKLLEGQATVHYYKLNDETALHLDSVGSLLQFVAPDYPEDICFYDHDSEPWMITISHEHDLYFSIEEDEIHFLESIFGKNNFYLN